MTAEPSEEQPAEADPSDDGASARWVVRLVAGCALLTGLAFVQAAGYQVADTKFDLVADPLQFLTRALHLWDGSGALGQLQNQAYGYLWPMGSFFLLLWGYQVPEWVIQRLWLALVLCVAFVGGARLARAMGVRSQAAALVAGFALATSPRMLSTVGWISIEAWPSAVAPWVLLALVRGSAHGSPRRAALLAGLGVAMVGGVNAAATFAVIPLGVVWLLTREPGPRRRSLMFWWPVFTLMGTLWWLVPLFLLGAYSPPFLDYIESARVTTFPTTVFDSLRGTSAWVPYIDESRVAGNQLVTTPYLALNSGIVLMLGLVGICLRSNPHRQFLVLGTVTGLGLVTMGHLGEVQGWFAGTLHDALDGVLAPVRNVHKFDPVVRVPLVIGLAWFVDQAVRTRASELEVGSRRLALQPRWTFGGLAVLGVLGASFPILAGNVATTDRVIETPDYWYEAVRWLDENADDSAVLVAPGSGFADYLWGGPQDEPVQYLGQDRWAVRNAIPLTPAGNIRMLDAIEERFNQGEGQPGLAAYLRRAGIGYVLVRNDLKATQDVPDAALVHQALEESPGIQRVTGFGPEIGGDPALVSEEGRLLANGGWGAARTAIDVYALVEQPARAVTADGLPVVVGGPEDLLDLSSARLLGEEPTQLAVDADESSFGSAGRVVLTDGMQERERSYGHIHDASSPVVTAGDVRRSPNDVPDYRLADGVRWLTTSRLIGARAVSASSSLSDSDTFGGSQRGRLPYAAVDGRGDSEWVAGDDEGAAWWELELEEPRTVERVTVQLGWDGADRAEVRVVTENGASASRTLEAGQRRQFDVGGAPISTIRVEDVGTLGRVSLAEVSFDGLDVQRPLVTPVLPQESSAPDAVMLRTLSEARTGCAVVDDRVPCRESQHVEPEEAGGFDRIVSLPAAAGYTSRLTARPRLGDELLDLIQRDKLLQVDASSTGPSDARASGLAAIDGDPGTTWTPSLDDFRPQLTLRWLGARRIDGLRIEVGDDAPVRRPQTLTLTWPKGSREVALDAEGSATFPAIRTDRLTVQLGLVENANSITRTGVLETLPGGVSELELTGLGIGAMRPSARKQEYGCGSGPTLEVNGRQHPTEVVASPAQLYAMEVVPTRLCEETGLDLVAGENRVRSVATGAMVAEALVLESAAPTPPPEVHTAAVLAGEVTRRISPTADDEVVVLRQNANPGWAAQQGGDTLTPVTVDGWQQGWRTGDRGIDVVFAEFEPDETYRAGVVVGLGLFALLVFLAWHSRWWSTGRETPPSAGRRLGLPAMGVLGVLAAGVLGGWAGLACAAAGGLVALGGRRLGVDAAAWLLGLAVWVASLAYFIRPWGSSEGWAGNWTWPDYLVLAAVGGALLLTAAPGPRSLRRMKGSSTTR